ncbi:pseudouridine synthase [Geotoga petraea]|jgi:16S rRNA pseudouridine516 synthase|nr:pseudouridine synthase [Geotoga petraea]MDK2945361.1 rRNA pseudouridine516 synthase [Geotoga sp.]SDB99276.1 ribosomal small subunit pseudouridine synthase A [Geotoga petraea]
MRLDKFLSNAKIGTRSQVKKLINKGKVKVNGSIIKKTSYKITKKDEVFYNDERIIPYHNIYIMLNKPKNYVSATDDKFHSIATDLIDHPYKNDLSIAGRLDIDTTGLILLSNDGDFIHKVISPENKIFKKYIVEYKGNITEDKINKLIEGIDLGDFITKPSKVKKLSDNFLQIEICEGKFHQIKRMIDYIDLELVNLHRKSIGDLSLDVDIGEWRLLDNQDIEKIFMK